MEMTNCNNVLCQFPGHVGGENCGLGMRLSKMMHPTTGMELHCMCVPAQVPECPS